ncbi:MAG: hypothetical protein FWE88_02090 [Phycisphaerae bacterium]|nr:hypothetical protein [Phycisphaerae bacterium]
MKTVWLPLMMLGWLLAGCDKAVAPDDFLYAYRAGAERGAPVSPGGAVYAGREGDYHVLKLRSGTPSEQFVNVTNRERTLRCHATQLPSDFPRGFAPLTGMEAFESSEDTREYVRIYLQRNMDSPLRQPVRPTDDDGWIQVK